MAQLVNDDEQAQSDDERDRGDEESHDDAGADVAIVKSCASCDGLAGGRYAGVCKPALRAFARGAVGLQNVVKRGNGPRCARAPARL